jgi:hypothetical protein
VQREPVRVGLDDKVRVGEPAQQAAGLRHLDRRERGGRRAADVRPRHQPQQAEQRAGRRLQPAVGQPERRPDGDQLVAVHRERGEPVARGQLGDVSRDRPMWTAVQVGRRDPQCQRQVAA